MTPTNTEALAAQAVPALCANCAPAGKCEKRQALCEPGMVAKTAQAVPAAPEQVTVEMLRAGAAEWLKYGEHHAKYPLAQGFESDGICPLQRIEHSRATHVYRAMRAVAPAAPAPEAPAAPLFVQPVSGDKLWLWQDGHKLLAYRHEYPCYSLGGDPCVLGEPVAEAEYRESYDRSSAP